MEPASLAATFAEIVGLVCHFRQEKGHHEALDHQKFIEWLEYHRHEELKNLIANTAAVRTEIDSLLRSEHAQMLHKLEQIGAVLINLLSRVNEFRGLVLAVAPDGDLSEQAVFILRQFVNSGEETFYHKSWGNGQFSMQLESGEQMEVTEPRFIQDDLTYLARLGLLAVEYNSQGDPIYGITRNAVRYIQAVDGVKSVGEGQ
ncbi:MAG TPA: hypothetical protein VFA90_17250 [Terriglobales bacterium]|jgi:hypothetical protein|nr:hypothetical protein [Terriglobales bacterium]